MHIGLDTVTLRGEGFKPHVKVGDRVQTGQPLIDFDADYVALNARSLLTQIVITNSDQVAKFSPYSGNVTTGDVILELALAGAGETAQAGPAVTSEPITSESIIIPNPTGLHARPAAVLVNLAKKYQSSLRLKRGDKEVSARSVVGIMGLEVGHGDKVQLIADRARCRSRNCRTERRPAFGARRRGRKGASCRSGQRCPNRKPSAAAASPL